MEARPRNWKRLLRKHAPLLLPAACDALTAKLIRDAGFPAYQIGGFALDGTRFGFPDMDVTRLGEKSSCVRDILHACDLPVLVDCDDGYGDAKNVTHTVHTYDEIGASAIFIEDQKSPKRCGHMAGKEVIPARDMVNKIKAAVEARADQDQLFLLGRTDAIEPEGLDSALKRAEQYRAVQRALEDLQRGLPMPRSQAVNMQEFEKIVDIGYWKAVEQQALPMGERLHQLVNKVWKKVA